MLSAFIQALACNADRIEHRVLTQSAVDPWVSPARLGLRNALFPEIPVGEEDPHAFSDLTDFARKDSKRFNQFVEGVKSHGFPVDDLAAFVNMEGERPARVSDGPSRLFNHNRQGPVLPQDVNWQEAWAEKPAPKPKKAQKSGVSARAATKEDQDDDDRPSTPQSPIRDDSEPSELTRLAPGLAASQAEQSAESRETHNSASGAPAADSGAGVAQAPSDDPMSMPPCNQAVLQLQRVATRMEEGSGRPAGGVQADQPLSALTSLGNSDADGKHSSRASTPSPSHGGDDAFDDPFAVKPPMDVDHSPNLALVPTQLVDENNRPRIEGERRARRTLCC